MGENSGDWGERGKNGVRGVRIPTAMRCVLLICCNGRKEKPEGVTLVCYS
jgi:hypothetical protein